MRLAPPLFVLLLLLAAGVASARDHPDPGVLPPVQREFRGVWVATVDNIDWPSKPGLPVDQQKAEIIAILDRAVKLKLNAVIFQVRPCCDAFYESSLEPWSEYLTGRMGSPPRPYYDPLTMWVEEAHKRGLELHAWFNPYRARHPTGKSAISANHVSKTRPELVRTYGKHLWLDPGDPEVQEYSLAVVRDVVKRYDIDGVHIDDYFFPYKEKDGSGRDIPFPDESSWQAYRAGGGDKSRDDWRRESVNTLVRRLYTTVKNEKNWVKFGISPFGIWRPGYPASVKGMDQYTELYADARKWLRSGWVDYFTPQLYWKVSAPNQSYPELLKWWISQNEKGRHIWVGNYTSRVMMGTWNADEISDQIRITREDPGSTGNIHFSAKALAQSAELNEALSRVYAKPALVPESLWLDDHRPRTPRLEANGESGGTPEIRWRKSGDEDPWLWVVRLRKGSQWFVEVIPGWQTARSRVGGLTVADADMAVVSAVDRVGNEGKTAVIELKGD